MHSAFKFSASKKSSSRSRQRQATRPLVIGSPRTPAIPKEIPPSVPYPNIPQDSDDEELPELEGLKILEEGGKRLVGVLTEQISNEPQGSLATVFAAVGYSVQTSPLPTGEGSSSLRITEVAESPLPSAPAVVNTPKATVPEPQEKLVASGGLSTEKEVEDADDPDDEETDGSDMSTCEETPGKQSAETDTGKGEIIVTTEGPPPENPIHGYPHPRSVLTDVSEALNLLESGGMDVIGELDYNMVKELAPLNVATSMTFAAIDVYDQIMMAYAARFYSTLPFAQPSLEVLKVLHLISVANAGGEATPVKDYEKARKIVGQINAERLDVFVLLVAKILLPADVRVLSTGLASISLSDFITLFDEVRMNYVEALIGYNVIHQIVVGGFDCVVPIPDICRSNEYLRSYLTKIASGNHSLRMTSLPITPRPTSLKTAATDTPIVIAPVPVNVPTALPKMKEKVEEVPIVPQGVVSKKKREGSQKDTQLMAQGKPAGNVVIRNTDSFRATVTADEELKKMCLAISASNEKILEQQNSIMGTLGKMAPKLAAIEASLAALAIRGANQDLTQRADYSRTIVQTQSSEAMQVTQVAPPLVHAVPSVRDSLIERLGKAPNTTADARLATDLTAFFKSIGETKVVKPSALSTQISRKRLASRLSNTA